MNQTTNSNLGTKAWITGVVGYSIVRAVLVWGVLTAVNPWLFAAIDILTAIPYAVSTAALPDAIASNDRRATSRHALIAAITFFAPYAYVAHFAAQAHNSTSVLGGLTVFMAIMAIIAVVGLRKKAKIISEQ